MARNQQQVLEEMLGKQQLQIAFFVSRIEELEEQIAKLQAPVKRGPKRLEEKTA